MTVRTRLLILLAATVVLAVAATGYTLHTAGHGTPRIVPLTLGAPGRIVFRDMRMGAGKDHLAAVPSTAPTGPRVNGALVCARFHAASGTGLCLRNRPGLTPSYDAVLVDGALRERRHFRGAGLPSRTRVSPSGHMAAWTVFVSGDSYGGPNFSTRTSILDTRTGRLIPSLEDFTVLKDGSHYRSADINFWGVTFADDDHFYATLATHGKTYLVSGDLTRREARTLHENVECPSLSPDRTTIVYKKRVRSPATGRPWALYALDLRTMRETALAESRNVDDQAVWMNAKEVAYSLPGDFGSDLWTVPVDGTGAPRLLLTAALNPVF
ncbi:TolB family protein [Actinomadura roseirufa]|uniref:TolB family protein n=1 Tax=Actinomadura roseirufa TaxID=2094049 RepID=UPI001041666F|nr:TolB-like translocation protein [Actinomadura roseirufa]